MTRSHAPSQSAWIRAQYWKYLPTHPAATKAIAGLRSPSLAFQSLNPQEGVEPPRAIHPTTNTGSSRSLAPSHRLDPRLIDALILDSEVHEELTFYTQNPPSPDVTTRPAPPEIDALEIELLASVHAIQASVRQAIQTPAERQGPAERERPTEYPRAAEHQQPAQLSPLTLADPSHL